MIVSITNQKGGVGKTSSAANLGVLLAREGRRVLLVDADPQFALTRQLGIEERSLGVNLVDVLAGRAGAEDAIVTGVHGVDVIASGRDLVGIELSLVGELGRERFLRDALEPVVSDYDDVVIDTPPKLGLLTVKALVLAEMVLAPVSAEDGGSLHGVRELQRTVARLAQLLDRPALDIVAILTRLGAPADQQPHDVARARSRWLGAGGQDPRSLGAVHSSGRRPCAARGQ